MTESDEAVVDNCLSKKVFHNERLAKQYAKYYETVYGITHHPYECPVCFWWHLTTGCYVGDEEKEGNNG